MPLCLLFFSRMLSLFFPLFLQSVGGMPASDSTGIYPHSSSSEYSNQNNFSFSTEIPESKSPFFEQHFWLLKSTRICFAHVVKSSPQLFCTTMVHLRRLIMILNEWHIIQTTLILLLFHQTFQTSMNLVVSLNDLSLLLTMCKNIKYWMISEKYFVRTFFILINRKNRKENSLLY